MDVTLLTLTILLITGGFVVFLLIQQVSNRSFCALCLAVTTAWMILLAALLTGYIADPVIIGILMGQTVVGSYYVLRDRLPDTYHLFSLPYILTLTVAVYMILSMQVDVLSLMALLGVWAVFIVLYLYRAHPWIGEKVDAIIECCQNW